MKYDKPMIAALIGGISTIPAEIVTRMLVNAGIGEYSVYYLDSLLITLDTPVPGLGFIVNFIFGGALSVLFYYALPKIGHDYLVLKSVAVGLIMWSFFEILFTLSIEGRFVEVRTSSDYYVHLIGTVVFGITLSLLFNKFVVRKSTLLGSK
jgi:hypothetical protein